jgi:integrase
MPKKIKDLPHHLRKRTPRGAYFIDISVPPDVRHHYDGKERLRHSLQTRDLEKALVLRNELLRELDLQLAVANLTDSEESSPSKTFSQALDVYKGEHPEHLENLMNDYELENDLHSNSKQQLRDHPTYAAMRQIQKGEGATVNADFSPTLSEVLESFLQRRTDLKESTINGYNSSVEKFGPTIQLASITPSMVNLWVDSMTLSKSNIKGKLIACSMLFKHAKGRGLISANQANPFIDIDLAGKAPIKKTLPTDPELLSRIVEICPPSHVNLWKVLCYTGIRSGEVKHLKKVEVDNNWYFKVLESKTSNGKDRMVPVHPAIADIELAKLPSSSVARRWLSYARGRGDLDGYSLASLHGTRAQFITAMLSHVPERVVAQIVGHATKSITQYYDRFDDLAALTEAILKLPDPFKTA